jgi:hypothetical protein
VVDLLTLVRGIAGAEVRTPPTEQRASACSHADAVSPMTTR